MNDQDIKQTAQEKVKEKIEFRIHLIIFVVVNSILATINLTLTPEYIWFKWPLLGWGIGIILHGLRVNSTGKSMKERMMDKEMKKSTSETIKNRR